jgi:hypothetical protein
MADRPQDRYEQYFAEKIWELIPATYRHEDGIAPLPGVLRGVAEILAEQSAILRRSHDRLWDDQAIDLCDDWAVPYIGDLLATRLVSILNPRGRRVDVAKTIYYRRRKGTLRVLEELITDITGWDGVVVEAFRRLARAPHGLDPFPGPRAGRFTGTPPGGLADLRDTRGATLSSSAWDEYAHTPDARRHRGRVGLLNIPKLVFHLYRLGPYRIEAAQPFSRADGVTFTFDPSGRDIPLFMPRARPTDYDAWRTAAAWEVGAPMTCRLLGHAEYVVGDALIAALALPPAPAADLATTRGVRFRSEQQLRTWLGTLPSSAALLAGAVFDQILAGALVEECGKRALWRKEALEVSVAGVVPPGEHVVAGNLALWAAVPAGKELLIDPDRGRFRLAAGPVAGTVRVSYVYGLSGDTGAGPYDRRDFVSEAPNVLVPPGGGAIAVASLPAAGVANIQDSSTYGPVANPPTVTGFTLGAAGGARPSLRLPAPWIIQAVAGNDRECTLEGLWLGGAPGAELVLRGPFGRVTIGHCTLDPGGTDTDGNPVEPIPIVVEGNIDELVLDHSIAGPISTRGAGEITTLRLLDSIVQARNPAVKAVSLPLGTLVTRRTTVLGAGHPGPLVDVERLDADATLITGLVDVTDTQHGCFRFSAALAGSRLPHPYESQTVRDIPALFTSRDFGRPGYAQLSEAAPPELLRGAEDGSEIGAWSALRNPIKLEGLAHKVEEYQPFGLIPVYLFET